MIGGGFSRPPAGTLHRVDRLVPDDVPDGTERVSSRRCARHAAVARRVMMMFRAVLERAQLPRVIGSAALARALERVGLTPESLTVANLPSALDSIYSTLRVYHEDTKAQHCFDRVRELCDTGIPDAS